LIIESFLVIGNWFLDITKKMAKRKRRRVRHLEDVRTRKRIKTVRKKRPALPKEKKIEIPKRFKVMMYFGVIVLASLFYFSVINPFSQDAQAFDVRSVITDKQMNDFHLRYNQGFRLFYIERKDIIPSQINFLPKDFELDWIQAYAIHLDKEFIKLKFPRIAFRNHTFLPVDIKAKISRKKGMTATLHTLQDYEIIVELVEESEDKIIGLVGLKQSH